MEEQGLGCTLFDSETKADDQLFYILWPGYGGWGAVVGAMFSTIAEGKTWSLLSTGGAGSLSLSCKACVTSGKLFNLSKV